MFESPGSAGDWGSGREEELIESPASAELIVSLASAELFESPASAGEGEGWGDGRSQAVWVVSSVASASQSYVFVFPMTDSVGWGWVRLKVIWGDGRGFAHWGGLWGVFVPLTRLRVSALGRGWCEALTRRAGSVARVKGTRRTGEADAAR